MNDWAAGYVHDVNYTYGYYQELNPLRAKFALTMAGFKTPDISTACEPGFGQGVSINIHSAAMKADWWGTDFIASQAAFAKQLANESTAHPNLFAESFSDFFNLDDMPGFDFIGLHGIWSWINDQNRHQVVKFIKSKLNVGGILYCNYNTLPGWAGITPLQILMSKHSEFFGSREQGTTGRVEEAMGFIESLLKTNTKFGLQNEFAMQKFKAFKDKPREYLAHEFFNENWNSMDFASIAKWLSETKVDFCCSANLLDHVPNLNLTHEQQRFLSKINDGIFRELARDFTVNQQHRRDYWVKGGIKLNAQEHIKSCRELSVVLLTNANDVEFKVMGELGEADVSDKLYSPILYYLSDHSVRTIHDIEKAVAPTGVNTTKVLQAIRMLVGTGHVAPARAVQDSDQEIESTAKLNQALKRRGKTSSDIPILASPVTGGGIPVNKIQMSFLRCLDSGITEPKEWAKNAQALLASQGEALVSEGKVLRSDQEIKEELRRLARRFNEVTLPMLKSIKVA